MSENAGLGERGQGYGALLGGARPMVDLRHILENVLERVHAEFGQVLQMARSAPDEARKHMLLSYLHSSRQQLLRLMSLVQWHPKHKALSECVEEGKVLDQARLHAQQLDAVPAELFAAQQLRQPEFSPMFEVQCALEVLSTGTYSALPSAIEELRPPKPLNPAAQQAKLRRVTHLIYRQLLKTKLPPGVEVVSVGAGYAVLRAEGLYEAKVTLVPAAQVPPEPEPAVAGADGAGAAAGADCGTAGAGTAAGITSAAAASQARSGSVDEDEDAGEATSGPVPVRWRWLLLAFLFPAHAVRGPPLQEAQTMGLLQDLNNRMHVAADFAVYCKKRKEREQRAAAAAAAAQAGQQGGEGEAGEGGAAGVGAEAGAGAAGGVRPAPSASLAGKPGVSRMSAHASEASGAGHERRAAANMALIAESEADEASAPLAIMHCILSDVGARLLLDAAMSVAQKLVGKGGPWEGHAQLGPSRVLRPGLRLTFWTQSVALQPCVQPVRGAGGAAGPAQGQGVGATTSGGGAAPAAGGATAAAAGGKPGDAAHGPGAGPRIQGQLVSELPSLEVGLAAGGGVQVLCHPALPQHHAPGAKGLRLDAATVNLDELMLRAAAVVARHELSLIKLKLETLLRDPQFGCELHLPWEVQLNELDLSWTPHASLGAANAKLATALAASSAAVAGAQQQQAAGATGAGGAGQGAGGAGGVEAGAAPRASPAPPYSVNVKVPALEFWTDGQLLLRVSRSLFTGRILMQPGPGGSSDTHLDNLTAYQRKEDEVNATLLKVYNEVPGNPAGAATQQESSAAGSGNPGAPGASGLGPTGSSTHGLPPASSGQRAKRTGDTLIRMLAAMFKKQQEHLTVANCLITARQLRLHLGGPSKRIVEVFTTANPWAVPLIHSTMWSFEASPFPVDFPPLHPSPRGTPSSLMPRTLLFSISASHPTAHSAGYSLLVTSASAQMVPLQLLRVIPIPSGVFSSSSSHAAPRGASGGGAAAAVIAAAPADIGAQGGNAQADTPGGAGGSMSLPSPRGPLSPAGTGAGQAVGTAGPGGTVQFRRDIAVEMEAVVRWCHWRMAWEVLVQQLKALQVHFVETLSPSPGHLSLAAVGSFPIPCKIPRRPGLSPSFIGVQEVRIELWEGDASSSADSTGGAWQQAGGAGAHVKAEGGGQGSGAGIAVRQQGGQAHGSESSDGMGLRQGHFVASLRGRFYDSYSAAGTSWCSSSTGSTMATDAHASTTGMLCAQRVEAVGPGEVRLHYSLAAGQSAAELVADVQSILKLQAFLARTEAELGAGAGQESLHVVCCSSSRSHAGRPGKRARLHAAGLGGMKSEAGGQAGSPMWEDVGEVPPLPAPGENGSSMATGPAGPAAVTMHWPTNGTVVLQSYCPTSAVLQYTAPKANAGSSSSIKSQADGGAAGGGGGPGAGLAAQRQASGMNGVIIKEDPGEGDDLGFMSFLSGFDGGDPFPPAMPQQQPTKQEPAGEVKPKPAAEGPARPSLTLQIDWRRPSPPVPSQPAKLPAGTGAAQGKSGSQGNLLLVGSGSGLQDLASPGGGPRPGTTIGSQGAGSSNRSIGVTCKLSLLHRYPAGPLGQQGQGNGAEAAGVPSLQQAGRRVVAGSGNSGQSKGGAQQGSAAAGGGPLAAAAGAGAGGAQSGPVEAMLRAMEEMADLEEEEDGHLLTALAVNAWAWLSVEQSIEKQPVALVLDDAPYGLRLLVQSSPSAAICSLPGRGALSPGAQAAVAAGSKAGRVLAADLRTVAVGRTWVRLEVLPPVPAPADGAESGSGLEQQMLGAVQERLLEEYGPKAVYVAPLWSSQPEGVAPSVWPLQGASSARRQLWFLVGNELLGSVLGTLFRLAGL